MGKRLDDFVERMRQRHIGWWLAYVICVTKLEMIVEEALGKGSPARPPRRRRPVKRKRPAGVIPSLWDRLSDDSEDV